MPGAGATITSFISYGIEKQYGRRRQLLGTGIPEGIVAPQIGPLKNTVQSLSLLIMLRMNALSPTGPKIAPSTIGEIGNLNFSKR
ncbi:MAG: tripartite tricarboxylate transporter permease [Xanthobacteraceae bacterium]